MSRRYRCELKHSLLSTILSLCHLVMNLIFVKKLVPFIFCILLLLGKTNPASSQNQMISDSIPPHHYIGVQIQACAMPGGSINTTAGNYHLHSKLQSCFSAAFVYQVNLGDRWSMNYGLQLNVISTNYYLLVPDSDLPGYPGSEQAPQIWDKQAYFKIALPVLLSYNFLFNKRGFYSARTEIKLNYSGFSPDERIGMSIADSNRQSTQIFSGDFTSNNNEKPWLSYVGSISKTLLLKNHGLFSIGLFAEVSTTDFIKGDYQVTIPNQPVTTGLYTVNGSCAGISFQYLFPQHRKLSKSSL